MTGLDGAALRPSTRAVRAGLARTEFDETAEALFLTSGYVYGSAAEAAAAFDGSIDRYVYSRYGNPTVTMFEDRMRALEDAEACIATASGMSAVSTALSALLKPGARLVASRSLFGSCHVVCAELLPSWGVQTTLIDGTDLDQWESALSERADVVFFESPSNPMQELVDISAVSALAHRWDAKVVVDNVFATPLLQSPLALGADVVVYSGTKHIDGHGRVMGGAILGAAQDIHGPIRHQLRHTGPALSPFNAWVLLKGLETLPARLRAQQSSAAHLAEWLQGRPEIDWVRYPFSTDHPQHELATRQMRGGGTVVTLCVASQSSPREQAWGVLDRLRLFDISNNLGDSKSLATHPATTTHRAMGAQARELAGITDAVIRLSIGLEDPEDLREDLEHALNAPSTNRL